MRDAGGGSFCQPDQTSIPVFFTGGLGRAADVGEVEVEEGVEADVWREADDGEAGVCRDPDGDVGREPGEDEGW